MRNIPFPVLDANLLCQCKSISRVKYRGIMYSKFAVHVGNSLILFHPNGNKALVPIPGEIHDVIWTGSSTELRVRRQVILKQPRQDPFEAYPHFKARLYCDMVEPYSETIQLSWIAAHYARCRWSESEVAVLSLSRVS